MLPIMAEGMRQEHFPVYGKLVLMPTHFPPLHSASVLHEESFSQGAGSCKSCRHAEISWNSMYMAMRQTTKNVIFVIFNVDPVLLTGVL